MDCVFCRMVQGTATARIIHQDDDTIVFFPLELNTKGHLVIAPTKHYANIFDIDSVALSSLMNRIQCLAHMLKERLGAKGINLLHASGKEAQQSVMHFHFHILPRYLNDRIDAWPNMPEWTGDLDELFAMLTESKDTI